MRLPLLLSALSLLLLACGGNDDPTAPPVATTQTVASPTVTPTEELPASSSEPPSSEGDERTTHPPGTRTGEEAVDTVLAALEADAEELSALMVMSSAPCTAEMSPGAVLCAEGQQPGTPTTVFLMGSCAPNYVRDLESAEDWVVGLVEGTSLYAVYPDSGAGGAIDASFQIILAPDDERELGVSLWVNENGEIVGATACGSLELLDIDPILGPPAAE